MPDARRSVLPGAAAALLVVASLAATPLPAEAEVYKWVDENGVTHYTVDRSAIPQHLRSPLAPSGALTAIPPEPEPVPLPPEVDPEDFARVPAQDVREALSLEEEIERDREAIKEMISRQGVTGPELANDPKLREIADRLPTLQNESDKLKRVQD